MSSYGYKQAFALKGRNVHAIRRSHFPLPQQQAVDTGAGSSLVPLCTQGVCTYPYHHIPSGLPVSITWVRRYYITYTYTIAQIAEINTYQ